MTKQLLLPVLLLASGVALAATPQTHKEATTTGMATPASNYSYKDADLNKDGMVDEAEYDAAVKGMHTELEGFRSKTPGSSVITAEPAGSPGDKPAADADPTGFKDKGKGSSVITAEPAGSPGDKPAADADPTAFKNKGAQGDVVKPAQ